jgi:hypothetical protein
MLIDEVKAALANYAVYDAGDWQEVVLKVLPKLIAAEELARLLDDIQTHREECFIPGSIGNRRDWDEDAANALAAYRKAGEDNAN